jgi:hypothetical protein
MQARGFVWRSLVGACSATAALVLAAGVATASHDPDVTDDEAKCQQGTSLAIGKFVTEKAKCLTKCEQGARKAQNPASDCVPPYADTTLACVQRAEGKAEALEVSKCAKDCPECYTGGDCTADADARVAAAEGDVDTLRAVVYCDDSGSLDGLTKAEAKCADTVAKSLSNFAKKKLNCYNKCRKDEHKEKVPVGSCDPPASDPKAADCVDKEETKAAFLIDKQCDSSVSPKAEKPECYGALTGAILAGLVETEVDNGQAGLYCGSPSGAFLN